MSVNSVRRVRERGAAEIRSASNAGGGGGERREGAHGALREVEGRAVQERVRRGCEWRHEPYEMRSRYENSPHTHLLLVGWWRCGRGAVEHELGRGAEAA